MSREEIQKLLSGYATGSLDEAERRALFEAALDDQELFDALAKEEALRDLLEDPSARQQLIEALGPASEPFATRAWRWLRGPGGLVLASGLAALLMVTTVLVMRQPRRPKPEVLVADAGTPKNAPAPDEPRHDAAQAAAAAKKSAVMPDAGALRREFQPPADHAEVAPATPLPEPPALAPQEGLPAPPLLPTPRSAYAPSEDRSARILVAPKGAATGARTVGSLAKPGAGFAGRLPSPAVSMTHSNAAKKAAVGGYANPALTYTLVLKAADGTSAQAPSGTVFHAGDSVRLRVEASETGFIYLLRRDPNGAWKFVEGLSVEKGQHYELPSISGFQSDAPAQIELSLVYSPVERSAPEADVVASGPGGHSFKITLEFR